MLIFNSLIGWNKSEVLIIWYWHLMKRRIVISNSKLNRNSGSVKLILDSLIGWNMSLGVDIDTWYRFLFLVDKHSALNLMKYNFELTTYLDFSLLKVKNVNVWWLVEMFVFKLLVIRQVQFCHGYSKHWKLILATNFSSPSRCPLSQFDVNRSASLNGRN